MSLQLQMGRVIPQLCAEFPYATKYPRDDRSAAKSYKANYVAKARGGLLTHTQSENSTEFSIKGQCCSFSTFVNYYQLFHFFCEHM